MDKIDLHCAICHEGEAKYSFVPNDDLAKCCNNCYSRLNMLYQSRGRSSEMAKNTIVFFSEKLPHITRKSINDRLNSIMQDYIDSVPGLRDEIKPIKREREKDLIKAVIYFPPIQNS